MDRLGVRIVLALLLIGAGIVFLLDSLEVLEIGILVWAAVFALAGLGFLVVFVLDREQWWALIPGFILLCLGLIVAVTELLPGIEGGWLGALFLGSLGLAFWAIFFVRRDFWWALIPGGVLWTVALVAGLSETLDGEVAGAVLFLGLGLTFAALSLVRTPAGGLRWALIPAGVMLLLGLAVLVATGNELFRYLWPVALILVGLYLLARTFLTRR